MAPLQLLCFFVVFFLIFIHRATSNGICPVSCGDILVRFPFRFYDQNYRCGYKNFDLSCRNRTQTILTLPYSGNFTVQFIDYANQEIWISDPDNCLPKRLLHSFNLSDSPFRQEYNRKFTFLNCSYNNTSMGLYSRLRPIDCLSGQNFTVYAIPTDLYDSSTTSPFCSEISTIWVPIAWPPTMSLSHATTLTWGNPYCRDCEEGGGSCGYQGNSGLEIGCYGNSGNGIPRSAKYGIIIGVGIPGLVSIIGLTCYICGRVRRTYHRHYHPTTEFSSSIAPQPAILVAGLDGPTIESYPKTLLGESRRLPNPGDNTCPICLCEYQPKETLRTIPECNHYFHANCVDEWLKLNATCPLCRNTPDGSTMITPSSSVFSSSSSLSSP